MKQVFIKRAGPHGTGGGQPWEELEDVREVSIKLSNGGQADLFEQEDGTLSIMCSHEQFPLAVVYHGPRGEMTVKGHIV